MGCGWSGLLTSLSIRWGYHVFGNYDWHEAADPEYWYYYQSGGENYPTTTGLSANM